MRLKPPVTTEEALEWLKQQAAITWGIEITPDLESRLRPTAEAMANVSRAEVPDRFEPLLM